MSRHKVIFIGDRGWPEFAEPLRWLSERSHVLYAHDAEWAMPMISAEQNPLDLLIVAQQRPGEFAHGAFHSLRAAAPITPVVCMLGSYCESGGRTDKPWPGVVRVLAHQFVSRLGRQLEQLDMNGVNAWSLPFTMTDEDRLLASSPIREQRVRARVAVFSDLRETASALVDLLRLAGCVAVCQTEGLNGDEVDVAIWDCQADFAASQISFEGLVASCPRTPKVVLIGFPRVADQTAALACGAAAVVSKPFLVDDLLWQLRECILRHST